MATFLALYGEGLDRELGTDDRTVRFTTEKRKAYVNEGARRFNEHVGCFVRRASIALVDGTSEYDLESASVIAAADYLRPSKTTASLRRVGATSTDYLEGPELRYQSEEELNQTRPNWRADADGIPQCWTLRSEDGSHYVKLVPGPDVPAAETWTLWWPYVAKPADMVGDAEVPWSISSNPRTTLTPYHDAILEYAAAQCEKLRKDWEAVEMHLRNFSTYIARYTGDQMPRQGSRMRLATDYRRSLRGSRRPPDPYR